MSLRGKIQRMRTDIRSAYKSEDTESFFDRFFINPPGYLCARLFMRLGWTPNMVSLFSMGIGFAGGLFFYPKNFAFNLLGAVLLIIANILDSTDGQMARLTGCKSTLGKILDALSASVWYVSIYIFLSLRLSNTVIPFSGGRTWGGSIWIITVVCALAGHLPQVMLSDYLKNAHLFFLQNDHASDLERSREIARQQTRLPWNGARFQKLWLFFYAFYTYLQELMTPSLQRILRFVEENGFDGKPSLREDYLSRSRRYIRLVNMLSFNMRAFVLFVCVLSGAPLMYFPIELLVFGFVMLFVRRKYERLACEVIVENRLPDWDAPAKKKKTSTVFFFILGVVGIVLMLVKTDLTQVDWSGTVLKRMPLWLPAILAVWAVLFVFHALAYRVIMGADGKKVKMSFLFKMTVSGYALNSVTPVGFAGGEPYRIMELTPYIGVEKATSSTLTFTVMNTFAMVAFWFTGALTYLLLGCPGGWVAILIALVMLLACGCGIYIFIRSGQRGLVLPSLRLLAKIPKLGNYFNRLIERKHETLEAIDRDMADFHTHTRDYWLSAAITYLCKFLEVSEFYILFHVLGASPSFAYCTLGLATASLIGNLLFIIPMQVGTREGGMALVLSWVGTASSLSVTASLLTRIREIICISIGVAAMLLKNNPVSAAKSESASETDSQDQSPKE